jgi:hypothetical protein
VWIIYENGRIDTFTHTGEIKESTLALVAQAIKIV